MHTRATSAVCALALSVLLGCGSPVARRSFHASPSQALTAERVSTLISDASTEGSLRRRPAPSTVGAWRELPAVGLRLRRVEGFDDAPDFAGYQRLEFGATLRVARLEVPMLVMHAGLTAEGLADQGLVLRERREVHVAGRPGLLLRTEPRARSSGFVRWVLVFGDSRCSHTLTATYPGEHEALVGQALREAMLGVELLDPEGVATPTLARSGR